MKLVDIIAGARPNFMKIAPIIRAIEADDLAMRSLKYRLVHTGQHYDERMSKSFFTQLDIPEPDLNLEVGSGSQAEQTAAIMVRYEKLLVNSPSDFCLVVGDVNSTMACAITAQKLGIPVAHVEGGLRSGDWSMPEEINRIVTDSIADWFFTTSETANSNLRGSGVNDDRIYFVGNTMIDTLNSSMPFFVPPSIWEELGLSAGEYFVLTLHRPANVDIPENIAQILNAIGNGTHGLPVIFPVHPRTDKSLAELSGVPSNIYTVPAQPYLEFNYLVKNAKAVITDSGGITEEATVMGVPCMTLRNTTERPETVSIGTNELMGTNPDNLKTGFKRLFQGGWKKGEVPEKWDGKAGERIVSALLEIL